METPPTDGQDRLDDVIPLAEPLLPPDDGGEPGEEGTAPIRDSLIRDYFETILVAVLIVLFLQTWVFQQSKIPSGSMEDTLLIGDHILVNKYVFSPAPFDLPILPHREPRRGDIVIFHPPTEPEKDYIKRLIGLPGDVVALREGELFINGRRVEEPYTKLSSGRGLGRNMEPRTVPPGHYFLMGDNRDESQDSRVWGPIPRGSIHGRAVLVWFSIRQPPYTLALDNPRARLEDAFSRLASFPSLTRWDRTLHPIR